MEEDKEIDNKDNKGNKQKENKDEEDDRDECWYFFLFLMLTQFYI